MPTEYLAGHNRTLRTGYTGQGHLSYLCGRLADVAWEAIDHAAHPWSCLVAYPPVQCVRAPALCGRTLVMAPTA